MLVIIPSYNDKVFLDRLLDSLFTEPAGTDFRVLVVSDFSNDGTEEWLSGLNGIDVIKPKEKSYFTRTCNAGLQWAMMHSKEQFMFLLNSDTIATSEWGSSLIATSKKFNAGIIGSTLLNMDGTVQHLGAYGNGYHFGINKPWLRYRQDRLVPWVTGAAMCIKRNVIDVVGLLPVREKRQYDASDRDYCTRARVTFGVEVAVSTGSVFYHDTHEARNIRLNRGDYSVGELAG